MPISTSISNQSRRIEANHIRSKEIQAKKEKEEEDKNSLREDLLKNLNIRLNDLSQKEKDLLKAHVNSSYILQGEKRSDCILEFCKEFQNL